MNKSVKLHTLIPNILPIVIFCTYVMVTAFPRIKNASISVLLLSYLILLLFFIALSYIIYHLVHNLCKTIILVIVFGFPLTYFHTFLSIASKLDPTIARYRYLLPLTIIVVTIFAVFIIRSRESLKNVSYYISTVFMCLIIYNLIFYLFTQNSILTKKNIFENRETKIHTEKITRIDLDYSPDVYYILLDSYTSSESLLSFWNFNNGQFEHALQDKGFYIASKSKSFYPGTIISMASTLNMDDEKNFIKIDSIGILERINNNKVTQKFEQKGYAIRNLSIFNIGYIPKYYRVFNEDAFSESEQKSSMLFAFSEIFRDSLLTNLIFTIEGLQHGIIIKRILSNLVVPSGREGIPCFTYAHLMTPHLPGKFDRNGNLISFLARSTSHEAYIDQILGTNGYILKVVDSILSQYASNRQPIIIIQGDHGNRNLTDKNRNNIEKNSILNAYYFPAQGNKNLYSNVSPYNTFRILFNTYFNGEYTLIPDLLN